MDEPFIKPTTITAVQIARWFQVHPHWVTDDLPPGYWEEEFRLGLGRTRTYRFIARLSRVVPYLKRYAPYRH